MEPDKGTFTVPVFSGKNKAHIWKKQFRKTLTGNIKGVSNLYSSKHKVQFPKHALLQLLRVLSQNNFLNIRKTFLIQQSFLFLEKPTSDFGFKEAK